MKRVLIIVLAMALCGLEAQAQMQRQRPEIGGVSVGIKGGVNFPRMLYLHNETMSQTDQGILVKPVAGVYADIPLNRWMSVAPEIMYVERGTSMTYQHHSGSTVNYDMHLKYADVRLPLELRWPMKSVAQPYAVVGAEVGLCLGDSIRMKRTAPIAFDESVAVGLANMNPLHVGVFGGVGIRNRMAVGQRDLILKVAATYHLGLLDSYSPMEKDGMAQAQNVNAYQVVGQRLPEGLELTVGAALSLHRHRDACSSFLGDRYRRRGSSRHLFGY